MKLGLTVTSIRFNCKHFRESTILDGKFSRKGKYTRRFDSSWHIQDARFQNLFGLYIYHHLNITHFYIFDDLNNKNIHPLYKNNLKLLGNLPSKIVDSRKCLQLNLIDVTLSHNFNY